MRGIVAAHHPAAQRELSRRAVITPTPPRHRRVTPIERAQRCAASLWQQLRQTHLAAIEWQVQPRLPLPVHELRHDMAVEAPPLIKGDLRCGAKVLGPPAWDPDFNTADLPLLLRIEDLPSRYSRHFLDT